ncbi:pollen-specific leucine-rich repeat extensin-like protein 1 isoform X2 [Copidosoma floridanum]|uniref:pollen-specific leucine-rich repeat extensin-like protein 1 isoform X2 n=1 Tax=Copidosoma floridanum TaxID=29053 RepID=UPI0006C974E5|nr:pollen-specific leucine-rich repeat extensin-like protein 1 isoform X2 [Copidosoma floridanum]
MREKSSECHAQASHHLITMTEMCSRESGPGVLQHHSSIAKANGKNPSSPQHQPQHSPQPHQMVHTQSQQPRASDGRLLGGQEDEGHTSNGNNLPTPGGRLKFFKDGKFILELSHRRDGERTTWFPVPKKTFWPPASVTPSRQESSASLSDDNSSIQSSPWQRDHCWKQTSPRRNISTEFNFYYRRNPKARLSVHPRLIARKRRQPLDTSSSLALLQESAANRQKSKQQSQLPQPPPIVRKLNGGTTPPNKSLNIIIEKLARLLESNVVSPRKRILRELERVSLEDQASKRRATPLQPANSTMANETAPPALKQLSSYSITSILGEDKISPSIENEPGFLRNLLKPQDHHHHHRHHHQSHSPQHQPHRSPQHQAHRSPQHQSHRSPQHQPHCSPQHSHSPQHHLSPPPVYHPRSNRLESTLPTTAYLSPNAAPSIHQPLYGLPILPPTAYRTPPFCWMHYTQPVHYPPPMPLYAAPPQPPPHTPSPSPPAHRYKDYREQTLTPPADKPLNLSKHAS